MPSLTILILMAIGAILIIRTLGKFGRNRPGAFSTPARTVSSGNAFCVHCGGALGGEGLFCGSCGARRG
jgi:hypothetical protein